MLGALASFAAMAIGIRAVGDTLSVFEIMTFRSLVGIMLVGALVLVRGRGLVATAQPRLQLTRNIVHFGGGYLWTLALTLLPLGVVTALEFSGPAWSAVFAVLLLGEHFTRGRLIAIALGFVGVLVILRPGIAAFDPASLLVLLAAALYAYANILAKVLVRTDTPSAIVFWMAVIQLPMAAIPAAFAWVWPEGSDYPWLLLVGLGGVGAHYCMSEAFARADAMTVVPIDFVRLPFMVLIGIAFFGEVFDPLVALGGAIICAGVWFNLQSDRPARTVARSA